MLYYPPGMTHLVYNYDQFIYAFVVKGYWHQTRNLSPLTISVTDSTVTMSSRATLELELRAQCVGDEAAIASTTRGRRVFESGNALCGETGDGNGRGGISACFAAWKEAFEVGNLTLNNAKAEL